MHAQADSRVRTTALNKRNQIVRDGNALVGHRQDELTGMKAIRLPVPVGIEFAELPCVPKTWATERAEAVSYGYLRVGKILELREIEAKSKIY